WFVHADAQPLPDSAETVIRILDAGAQGGYFRFGLTGERTVLKILTEWSVALRCRFGGIPYGDQGLFVRREAYVQVGGHLSAPLFEEARLVRRLRNMGGFNGIDVPIGVNPERWDQEGYLKRGLKNRLIVLAYWMGVSPWRLARWYSGS
ncbi:MAG: glycosyl transferase family 2, partial [Pseudomonadota bacterium]